MFYAVNAKGNFLAGYVPAGERFVRLYEGIKSAGIAKITKKLDCVASSVDDAWERLCEEIVAARADGYLLAPYDSSIIEVPDNAYQAEIPESLRGIYAHVMECTEEHFLAGLDRLKTVHEVLSQGGAGVELKVTDRSVKLSSTESSIHFGLADLRVWETMSLKAKELCEERGMFNSTQLLPSGKGLWRMQTCESVLDLYVRAFLAGALEAGAAIGFTADQEWKFSAQRSFHSADVATLQWYRESPKFLDLVHGIRPQAAPVVQSDENDLFLFL
ncbi:hypothetical protein [Pseudomonas baetica]|uniref:hypothetical protein n=1 Tax=Pseudomonas baetica TaxID=674054 RepID=UPI0024067C4D|nr:hypothetical protein [Pseudomonas baetica]MDF9779197.1 hypothetical protein [Pseudomonas baetica]